MSATLQINRLTGAGPAYANVTATNSRENAFDTNSTADTTSPITVPAAGTNYSYWAVFQLECTAPPSVLINNLKWFTDGANGFGTGVGMNVNTATGYVQASGTPAVTGIQLTVGNYATLAGAPTDAFAKTSGSPLSVAGSTSTAVKFGDRVVTQITVGTTGLPGATSTQEQCTWQWDEV